MRAKSVIFFDCMETLIDMYELPGEREYALWAFEGSGVEGYWKEFSEFLQDFLAVRRMLKEGFPQHKEYDIEYRFRLVVEKKTGKGNEKEIRAIVDRLVSNYWYKYKKLCYVSKEVTDTIIFLHNKGYKMGVVSNFLIKGGVQEILSLHGLDKYLHFVVTSVDEGWRKPHPNIYERALIKAGVAAKESIFIGDDYLNDYVAPKKLGFASLLFDKDGSYPQVDNRIQSFKELRRILEP